MVFLLSILAYFIWSAFGRDDNPSSTDTQQGSGQIHSVDDVSIDESAVVAGTNIDFYVTGFTKQVKYN
ncbi:hypothetical protein HWV00_17120 [Moritella sp. 24]|uniref:hypothetical protein n=1 Tax=Moritella sp. 24 TaxID=2746230 RepID=UPI001BA5B098|nr:hypothetical protein [Moritella sp. 24]QUM77806.1 hypothetical protein HWV00_17120 [Moritella sp. 24]